MQTLILDKPGELRLTESPKPDRCPPGCAIVRVRRVGICGTDWHAFHGRQPFFTYPRILGHELGVEIVEIDDEKSDLMPGDRCAVEPYLNCGRCSACVRGMTNCCSNLSVLGVHIDGGMRERIVVPATKLHRSEKLTFDQLALVETLAIGCHAVNRAQIQAGEDVLVIGAGPIGLSILPFAQLAGARITVADISPRRLEFCRKQMGVDSVIAPETNLDPAPTVIFDATGNAQSMSRCFDSIAQGGRIVFVGLFQGDMTFNDPNFHRREITLLASRNAVAGDFKRIIQLIEAGRIDTTPWITHRATCDRVVESIREWLAAESGLLKAIVEF